MLETKGYWDAEDRRKIKAVMRDNPDIDLRMVFQAPFNKISKNPNTYAQWCEKHGIQVGKCTRNPHRLVNIMNESEFVAHEPCPNCRFIRC